MIRHGAYDFDKYIKQKSFFCDPWKTATFVAYDLRENTDADLAAEINALSFEERQAMEEDIIITQ